VSGAVRVWYATVYVRDFERALRFYRDKLELPPTQQPRGGTLAQLADPEGNLLTLDQYRQE